MTKTMSNGPRRQSFIDYTTGGASNSHSLFNHTYFTQSSDCAAPPSNTFRVNEGSTNPIAQFMPPTTRVEPVLGKPAPRKRGRRPTKTIDPNHVPRPPNCFMQFRKQWIQGRLEAMNKNPLGSKSAADIDNANDKKTLSKQAGEVWRSLSEKERSKYIQASRDAKKEHEEKYPDYKFRPKRKPARSAAFFTGMLPASSGDSQNDPDWVPSVLRPRPSVRTDASGSPSSTSRSSPLSSTCSDDSQWYSSSSRESSYFEDSVSDEFESTHNVEPLLSFQPQAMAPPPPPPMHNSIVFSSRKNLDDMTPTQADFRQSSTYFNHLLMLQEQQQDPSKNSTLAHYDGAFSSPEQLGIDLNQFPLPPSSNDNPNLDPALLSVPFNSFHHVTTPSTPSPSTSPSPSCSSSSVEESHLHPLHFNTSHPIPSLTLAQCPSWDQASDIYMTLEDASTYHTTQTQHSHMPISPTAASNFLTSEDKMSLGFNGLFDESPYATYSQVADSFEPVPFTFYQDEANLAAQHTAQLEMGVGWGLGNGGM